MAFYSFIVLSPEEMPFPEYLIHLERGRNVFNANVNDLDRFRERLTEEGVQILQVNRLDIQKPLVPMLEPYPDLFAEEPKA